MTVPPEGTPGEPPPTPSAVPSDGAAPRDVTRALATAYLDSPEQALAAAGTSPTGLSHEEAEQRRLRFGGNVIVRVEAVSPLRRYLAQFADWMIGLLLVSALITGGLGDVGTAAVLVLLVLINTLIGFVQEMRAEKTMAALEKLVDPACEVYRDGALVPIESTRLVVGDLVRLTEGASVPADVRLIETTVFSTNEFALTGESDPTRKHARAIPHEVPLADRRNLAFAGTTVATGEATGVVIGVGGQTELGRIAALSQSAPVTRSPLQRETTTIARYVSGAVAVISLIVLVIAVQADLAIVDALLFAVGFACALIPQGLPAEVSTALAAAAGDLARRGALVKKLSAVETLGATHVICTDKTGTLTRNEMTVTELEVGGARYRVTGTGYEPTGALEPVGSGPGAPGGAGLLRDILAVGVLASNARLVPPGEGRVLWSVLGDPTEGALLVVAHKAGVDLDAVLASNTEIGELPFDSSRKVMTSIRRDGSGVVTACVKGAPESILARSTRIDDGTRVRPITDADRAYYTALHNANASLALRNLALARRVLTEKQAATGDIAVIETGLTLLGMVSMMDPIRESVPEAMADVLAAGVKVNIVTGDFSRTAEAIARQAGLAGDDGLVVITGTQLNGMPDSEVLEHALRGGTVFSRVTPDDKVRIVDLVKESAHVVAVTGDGINDAPALRHADIGVAMGESGTDVAAQSAEIVLLDDSFATLVGAVRQGRTIYRNIAKGVLSCLTSNSAEFVANSVSLALTSMLGLPLALNVLQILAIDLLGELLPIAALGRDREEGETMREKPRPAGARIVNRRSLVDLAWSGLLIGGFAIANFLFFFARNGIDPAQAPPAGAIDAATSMTYATIMTCQLVSIIQRRSVHGFFTRYQFSNSTFWWAMGASSVIMLAILYLPFLAAFFGTAPLGPVDWVCIAVAASLFLAIRETGRVLRARRG